MTNILMTLLVGLVVGAVARLLLPGDQRMGWIMTSLLGVAGSFLASFAGQVAGFYVAGDKAGWIASVLGAMVLLFVVSRLQGAGNDQA
ncbi:GlsB/YeaQ/YmgE family stress response membrane protein [Ideonella sp. 4Y16]|uniref:GlsB/YeaQ/YmgE family stress response membrane protein n=1 Tax=Ideonella alba TaxID=2824118 RepID=A0A941BDN5_9BURK|nr:GlsB/YeaQ/YmgE family stress response membrane protein [Ideonella alba]MBQ0929102.1 GlsB/YeaQ/YmgE family stress response membrane protein [Ideonella alba]MBQ0943048.1 GlsB/YeaQ/YmgE family stress response membrane protein [Ideonella alba]